MRKIQLLLFKTLRSVLRNKGLVHIPFIRQFHAKWVKNLKTNTASVLGHTMYLDDLDTLNLSVYGIYEEFETNLIKQEVKKGDVILDIGANIGYYTLIFAKLVGESGKVYAFEPDPTNFALLKKNIEANGYNNVVLIQKAVSNKSEKIKLYISKENRGDHRIYPSYESRQTVEIECVRIDDYNIPKVDFIKMDIQGSELGAIQGMENLLNLNQPLTLITELWPFAMKKFGTDAREYINLLENHRFQYTEIDEKANLLKAITKEEILSKYTPDNHFDTNLFCVRK
jgi:FkbM family methyltransferase